MPSGIYFSQENMQTALNIIVQYLRDSGYDGSLEDGTGISDIVLKPSAMLYTLFSQQLTKAKAYQSLAKAEELRSTIGEEEYAAAVDTVLSNWFVTRNTGTPCVGTVRLFFLALPSTMIHFSEGQVVAYAPAYSLVATKDCTYVMEDFSVLMNTAGIDEYYIDIPVRSSINTADAPKEGDLFAAAIAHAYYKRASATANFIPGESVESTDSFINRTKYAITTRELVTERAVHTVLPQSFPDIKNIYIARNGSAELMRDLVTIGEPPVSIHVGNMADIYLSADLYLQTEHCVVCADGSLTNDGNPMYPGMYYYDTFSGYVYIFKEAWSCDNEGKRVSEEPDVLLTITLDEKNTSGYAPETIWSSTRFLDSSTEPDGKIFLSGTIMAAYKDSGEKLPYGTAVEFNYLTTTLLRTVHDFVYNTDQRIICYDPLVKHKFPLITSIDLSVILEENSSEPDVVQSIKNSVTAYVRSLAMSGKTFTQSEMVTKIHTDVPQVQKVVLPAGNTFELFDPLTVTWKLIESTVIQGCFDASVDLPAGISEQISNNTIHFYTDDDHINITVVRG